MHALSFLSCRSNCKILFLLGNRRSFLLVNFNQYFIITCCCNECYFYKTSHLLFLKIIVKLFLLKLHFLNLIVLKYVMFAFKMLIIKYTNTIYDCYIQHAHSFHTKFTSNAGIPLEHGFGKSEGVGTHLKSSGVCTNQLFANIAMSSV